MTAVNVFDHRVKNKNLFRINPTLLSSTLFQRLSLCFSAQTVKSLGCYTNLVSLLCVCVCVCVCVFRRTRRRSSKALNTNTRWLGATSGRSPSWLSTWTLSRPLPRATSLSASPSPWRQESTPLTLQRPQLVKKRPRGFLSLLSFLPHSFVFSLKSQHSRRVTPGFWCLMWTAWCVWPLLTVLIVQGWLSKELDNPKIHLQLLMCFPVALSLNS